MIRCYSRRCRGNLFADKKAAFDAQLSYLTNGMSWKSDYNLVLPEKGDTVTLTGWVSIENNTGKTFEGAKIKLIAGDVNKVEPPQNVRREKVYAMAMADSAAAPQVEEKKFDEFHMYSLPLATTCAIVRPSRSSSSALRTCKPPSSTSMRD